MRIYDPDAIKWLPLYFDDQTSIQDVTSAIVRQSRLAKNLNELPSETSLSPQSWHTLPRQQSSSIDNSGNTKTFVAMERPFNGSSHKSTINGNKCLNCIKACVREKQLRDRLRMAETFIHTMNRNLEIDTVAISGIVNKRTALMNKLEESNLKLHQEKHRCQMDLVNAESQLHEKIMKDQHLEAENNQLKSLVERLSRARKLGENHAQVTESDLLDFKYLSSSESCNARSVCQSIAVNLKEERNGTSLVSIQSSKKECVEKDGAKKCRSLDRIYSAQRKEVEQIMGKELNQEKMLIDEVSLNVNHQPPLISTSTPKKDQVDPQPISFVKEEGNIDNIATARVFGNTSERSHTPAQNQPPSMERMKAFSVNGDQIREGYCVKYSSDIKCKCQESTKEDLPSNFVKGKVQDSGGNFKCLSLSKLVVPTYNRQDKSTKMTEAVSIGTEERHTNHHVSGLSRIKMNHHKEVLIAKIEESLGIKVDGRGEENCHTDQCYILRLKDQAKGIREELIHIQNLLSDLKE